MSTVLITGGSRGIGAAAVELFAARGDAVFFLYEKERTSPIGCLDIAFQLINYLVFPAHGALSFLCFLNSTIIFSWCQVWEVWP